MMSTDCHKYLLSSRHSLWPTQREVFPERGWLRKSEGYRGGSDFVQKSLDLIGLSKALREHQSATREIIYLDPCLSIFSAYEYRSMQIRSKKVIQKSTVDGKWIEVISIICITLMMMIFFHTSNVSWLILFRWWALRIVLIIQSKK